MKEGRTSQRCTREDEEGGDTEGEEGTERESDKWSKEGKEKRQVGGVKVGSGRRVENRVGRRAWREENRQRERTADKRQNARGGVAQEKRETETKETVHEADGGENEVLSARFVQGASFTRDDTSGLSTERSLSAMTLYLEVVVVFLGAFRPRAFRARLTLGVLVLKVESALRSDSLVDGEEKGAAAETDPFFVGEAMGGRLTLSGTISLHGLDDGRRGRSCLVGWARQSRHRRSVSDDSS